MASPSSRLSSGACRTSRQGSRDGQVLLPRGRGSPRGRGDPLPRRQDPRPAAHRPRLLELHFGLSFALVATLFFGLGYDLGFEWKRTDALYWFLGGCAVYYALGAAPAAALKDNRAFCKYACPVSVFLRSATRLSLLKVAGTRGRCTRWGTCDTLCPMGVKVSWYVHDETRVLDPECTLCQTCVTRCPEGNLGLSLGLDVGTTRLPPPPPKVRARV